RVVPSEPGRSLSAKSWCSMPCSWWVVVAGDDGMAEFVDQLDQHLVVHHAAMRSSMSVGSALVEWGVHLPHLGYRASRDPLLRFARRVDELGFHSGWVSDHIAWPQDIESKYPYSDDGSFPAPAGMPWLDPLGTLFFVAACTEHLRLGTSVLILGYRPPVLTAKAVASLDVVSGGRAILGVGVGWMKEEFEILGMP